MALTAEQARMALAQADCLYAPAAVEQAVDRMAEAIAADLADSDPILMCVMNGGLVPTAMLMARLHFPLKVDYLHATRYRERTTGTDLQWKKHHESDLAGRTVLVIDDDQNACDLMARGLAREGFQVRTATNGEAGLRLARVCGSCAAP